MSRTHGTNRARIDAGAAALWAAAVVLLALVIVQAGRLGGGPGLGQAAMAGDVAQIGDMTILTADSGDNADILAILDRRGERLFIYGVKDSRSIEMFQSYDLARMFTEAREAAGLKRP